MLRYIRIIAIWLLFFNGISAIGGGLMLIIDPTGQLVQLPISFLDNTPFNSFLIPGIILFIVNGLMSLVIAFLTIYRHKYFSYLIIFQGIVLATWLSVQIIMIREFFPPMHLTCYIIALGMVTSGTLLIRYNRDEAIANVS